MLNNPCMWKICQMFSSGDRLMQTIGIQQRQHRGSYGDHDPCYKQVKTAQCLAIFIILILLVMQPLQQHEYLRMSSNCRVGNTAFFWPMRNLLLIHLGCWLWFCTCLLPNQSNRHHYTQYGSYLRYWTLSLPYTINALFFKGNHMCSGYDQGICTHVMSCHLLKSTVKR